MVVRVLTVLLLLSCSPVSAQPLAERFVSLLQADGVAGREDAVREAIRAQLPRWAEPRVDELGNLVVTIGSGRPHLAMVASLDEGGHVVSRITDDGYLRLHRHTASPSHRLADQFVAGQPVSIRTSAGARVPGVIATESLHLRTFLGQAENQRVRNVQDLWVDVGARSASEVERLGIRLLDPVSLHERVQKLAGGRIAGVAGQSRAGAQALVDVLRSFSAMPVPQGTVTLAWAAQSQYGGRGLARLADAIRPDRAILLAPAPRRWTAPPGWEQTAVEHRPVAVLFPETPVEVVDTHDIAALAADLTSAAGLAGERSDASRDIVPGSSLADPQPELSPTFAVLKALVETSGVSGHEAPVRETVLAQMPSWATPQVDAKGNITVSFGSGGKELVFVAHTDEVGFEITGIREDGRAGVRTRGGMVLSLFEAHPVMVQTAAGLVPAVVTPREGYESTTTQQPDVGALSLHFGTTDAAATKALGIEVGQSATVRKRFTSLAGGRATARSMDDRGGSTALIMALRSIDPKAVKNRVTFAWTVEEETGLAGARALAERLRPHTVFAVDTFVTSDAPLDATHLAHAPLGAGAVVRVLDSRSIAPAPVIDRILAVAREGGVPVQLGMTLGGTDAAAFSAGGAVDIGLSWPGRYSHSPVEVLDGRDLDALAALIVRLAERY